MVILVMGGFACLAYASLAQTPIGWLGEIHRVSRVNQWMSFPNFTAVGHFIAYGAAAALSPVILSLSGPGMRARGWQALSLLGLAMLAIGFEIAQQGTHTRSFDWVDMAAGVAGVALVAPAILLPWARRQPN